MKRTRSPVTDGMAPIEHRYQHHGVSLGLHNETETTGMPKSIGELGQIL